MIVTNSQPRLYQLDKTPVYRKSRSWVKPQPGLSLLDGTLSDSITSLKTTLGIGNKDAGMIHLDTGLGTHFGELGQVADLAQEAEATGFGALWAPETKHDPFMPLALAAEHTSQIKLGTAVAIAFPRSPMVFANIGWDLAKFSSGRFILGLGTQVKGHNVRRFSTDWVAPGPRLRDMVLAIRAILGELAKRHAA